MHHFVLTRFDVYLGDQSKYRTDEWFTKRLDLFERFTRPSVESQDCQDFTWLVFFHERSRADVEDRFGSADLPYTPIYTSELWEPAVVRKAVRGLGIPDGSHVVSTQLDCDDAYAPDTVRRIQAAVRRHPLERRYFNFPIGYQFCDGRFYLALDPSNPFITLSEPVSTLDDAMFAYHVCHDDASDFAPVSHIDWSPGWMQIVHDTNIANHVNGLRIRNPKPWASFRHLPGVGPRLEERWIDVETDRLGNAAYLTRKALFKPGGRRRVYRALKLEGAFKKRRTTTSA
jgi:hypothetical protein